MRHIFLNNDKEGQVYLVDMKKKLINYREKRRIKNIKEKAKRDKRKSGLACDRAGHGKEGPGRHPKTGRPSYL